MDEYTNQDIERIIVIHRDESGGYWVEVPSLRGCISQGATLREACEMIGEAMELYLESLEDFKEVPPAETHVLMEKNRAQPLERNA